VSTCTSTTVWVGIGVGQTKVATTKGGASLGMCADRIGGTGIHVGVWQRVWPGKHRIGTGIHVGVWQRV
jgi:hypothetical protein